MYVISIYSTKEGVIYGRLEVISLLGWIIMEKVDVSGRLPSVTAVNES
jgi:hypothetical protein